MSWTQLTIETDATQAESLADLLSEWGAVSVSLQDAADEPLYEPELNTTPVWSNTRVSALFEPETALDEVLARVESQLGAPPRYIRETLQEQDWVRAGQDFAPLRFGQRLWICPSWERPPQPEAVNILLDPGLAFGTGTHPTTAQCLEWLDANAEAVVGKTVIDYGCGSGILGIAALKLGAAVVWAVDNDPQALLASRDNADKNGVADRLHACLPGQLPALQADILLANILANPLCELAPRFSQLLPAGGLVVLSGILGEQQPLISDAYAPWFAHWQTAQRDNWLRLVAQRTR